MNTDLNQIRILVFDDHPVVRDGLIFMVNKEPDIEVVGHSGETKDFVPLVQAHRPDVVLLDIHMDGQTFALARKARDAFPELKVLYITAFDSEENVGKVKAFGGQGLVSKLEGESGICRAIRTVALGYDYFTDPSLMQSKSYRSESRPRNLPSHHPLSPREVDILCCVAHAMTAKEIAKDLRISVKTVDRHKANIMEKLNMRSQIELARYAIRHGFVEA